MPSFSIVAEIFLHTLFIAFNSHMRELSLATREQKIYGIILAYIATHIQGRDVQHAPVLPV